MKCKMIRMMFCVMALALLLTGCGPFTLYSDTYIDEYAQEKYGEVTLVKQTKIDSRHKNYVYQSPLGFQFTIESILTNNAVFPGLRYRGIESDYKEKIFGFYREKLNEIAIKHFPSENIKDGTYGLDFQIRKYAQCANAAAAIYELRSYLRKEGRPYNAKNGLYVSVKFGEGKNEIEYPLDDTEGQEVLQKEIEMYEIYLIQREGLQDDTITGKQMTEHPQPIIEHFTFNSAETEDLKKVKTSVFYSIERNQYEVNTQFDSVYDPEDVGDYSRGLVDLYDVLLLKYCPGCEHKYNYKTKTLTYKINGNSYEIYYPYNEFKQKLEGEPTFKCNGKKMDIKIYRSGNTAKTFRGYDGYYISVTDLAALLEKKCNVNKETGTLDFFD